MITVLREEIMMTDKELLKKIEKIIATKTRFNNAGCMVSNADTVAQEIMNEVTEYVNDEKFEAWSQGWDLG